MGLNKYWYSKCREISQDLTWLFNVYIYLVQLKLNKIIICQLNCVCVCVWGGGGGGRTIYWMCSHESLEIEQAATAWDGG